MFRCIYRNRIDIICIHINRDKPPKKGKVRFLMFYDCNMFLDIQNIPVYVSRDSIAQSKVAHGSSVVMCF